jgi:hydrogenase maturation protein HypF
VGIAERTGLHEIDFAPLFIALLDDMRAGTSVPDMARSFHSALAMASLDVCRRIRDAEGLERVVLSGGVFQNRLLTEELWGLLADADFQVYTHRLVPPNDGGLALGQAMIAARRVSCV